jgi:predicted transcriptional regulator
MTATSRSLDDHLEAALESATDESARYHIRQALQLRLVEAEWDEKEELSA